MKCFLLSLSIIFLICSSFKSENLHKNSANKCCKNVAPVYTSVNKTKLEKGTQTITYIEEYTHICNTTTTITHTNTTTTPDTSNGITNILTSVGNIITAVVCDLLSAPCTNNNNNNNNVIITTSETVQTSCTKTRVAFK